MRSRVSDGSFVWLRAVVSADSQASRLSKSSLRSGASSVSAKKRVTFAVSPLLHIPAQAAQSTPVS